MPIRFVFKETFVPGAFKNGNTADPDAIGQELTRISDAHAGKLSPHDVCEEAKRPRNPLHRHFEWNDKILADRARVDTARSLIGSIRLTDTDRPDDEPRRAFLNLNDNGHSYRSCDEVMSSAHLRIKALEQVLRELDSFEGRWGDFVAIADLVTNARGRVSEALNDLRISLMPGRAKAASSSRPQPGAPPPT